MRDFRKMGIRRLEFVDMIRIRGDLSTDTLQLILTDLRYFASDKDVEDHWRTSMLEELRRTKR